jgi:glucose/arabinose dehydrogenase
MKSLITFCSIAVIILSGCSKPSEKASTISTDTTVIALGQKRFAQNCTACHNFKNDGIGPQLGGLTHVVSPEWIKDFIKDPKAKIESGDERAKEIFNRFKTQMPGFNFLPDEELDAIVAFINTKEAPDPRKAQLDPNALTNPIPEPIPMSAMVVSVEPFAKIPPSSERVPFTRITKLTNQPKTDKLFVVDLRGKLFYLNGDKPKLYLDMEKERPKFMNVPGHGTGFGSFAFHPDFAKNGLLYTTHSEFPGSAVADFAYPDSIKVTLQWVVTEWKTKTPAAIPFVGESRELLRVNMINQTHGVQEIAFNPTSKPGSNDYGLLYIGIGDGGSSENEAAFLCGTTEKIWGTVIRIDPAGNNSINGKYGIPNTNPFVSSENPNTVKEIFAYGFRNPHRIIWDQKGRMFVPNIGQHSIEGLYLVEAGNNCGWPTREGTFVIDPAQNMHNLYPLPTDDAKNNFTYPIAQYDHDEGNAIAGGYEYQGKKIPELKGKFLFGDIVKGRLFYIEMKDVKLGTQAPIKEFQISLNGEITTLFKLCGADKNGDKVDERFHQDRNGELYLTTKPDGMIYKIESAVVNK